MFGTLILLIIFFWFWVGSRYSALGLVSSPTIKATFSPSWTRRRSICQPRRSFCNSSSWSMPQGFNWRPRTWRGITTDGLMNLFIPTSLAFALTGNYQWEKLFPILNFCGLFWMTRRLPLNLRVKIPNVVRPTTMPPKVHWSQVAAADFLLTVVISHLNNPWWILLRASSTLRRVVWIRRVTPPLYLGVSDETRLVMDAFGIWQKPSRTSQLHSKSAASLLQLLVFGFWHFQFYSGTPGCIFLLSNTWL